jgi:hypothetical protein
MIMGYSYSGNKLCCENCGKASGVRKRPCPHGWCQPHALCTGCYATAKPQWKEVHAKCIAPAREYAAKKLAEKQALDEGKYLRCSALGIDNNRTHVLFRNKSDQYVGLYVPSSVYRSYALSAILTPDDFQERGGATPAPAHFGSGKTSKAA